jgi:hypothetical protein
MDESLKKKETWVFYRRRNARPRERSRHRDEGDYQKGMAEVAHKQNFGTYLKVCVWVIT